MSNKGSETHDVVPLTTQLISKGNKSKPKNASNYVIQKNIKSKKRPKLIGNQQSRSTNYSDPIYLQQLLERSQATIALTCLIIKNYYELKARRSNLDKIRLLTNHAFLAIDSSLIDFLSKKYSPEESLPLMACQSSEPFQVKTRILDPTDIGWAPCPSKGYCNVHHDPSDEVKDNLNPFISSSVASKEAYLTREKYISATSIRGKQLISIIHEVLLFSKTRGASGKLYPAHIYVVSDSAPSIQNYDLISTQNSIANSLFHFSTSTIQPIIEEESKCFTSSTLYSNAALTAVNNLCVQGYYILANIRALMENAYTSFPRIVCKFFSPARIPLQLGVKNQDIDLSQEFHLFPAAEEYIECEPPAENRPPEEYSEAIEDIRYLFIDPSQI
ncbi:MAG: hypothetical protein MRQ09_01370 [Candidatus Midichloria sp.]|nr:hypothetical protein [Candidatus Midichloria sp.]